MNKNALILGLLVGVLLIGCTKDLSKRPPYREAIGKQFMLQQDLYVYSFNDYEEDSWFSFPCKLRLGKDVPKYSLFLPATVEEKYVGAKNFEITLKGILKKGEVFTIRQVIKRNTVDNVYYFYLISPIEGVFASQEINPSDFVQFFDNPPYTKTWSDPPIFNPQYALPLPSDGVWWK